MDGKRVTAIGGGLWWIGVLASALLALPGDPGVASGDEGPAGVVPVRELVREPFTLDHLSSDWEILSHDPDGAGPVAGKLRIVPAPARDWHELAGIRNLVRYRFPVFGERLVARTDVTARIHAPGQGAALMLYQDDANWVELAFRGEARGGSLERVFRLTRSRAGERTSEVRRHGRGPSSVVETVRLVLEREGPRFTGRMEIPMESAGVSRKGVVGTVSAPGLDGFQVILKALRADRAAASDEAPERIAFDEVVVVGRSADASLGDAPDSLRLAYATEFREPDAFRRDFSVHEPVPESLALEDGLELVARYGIPGDRWTPIKNLVVLDRRLPSGEWDVEVAVDATITSVHDDVGLVLRGEGGDALYVGHWALPERLGGGRRAYLRSVADGRSETRFEPEGGSAAPVAPTSLVFRIENRDDRYVAWVDVGGQGWTRVGESTVRLRDPRLGLFARSSRDAGGAPGSGVRFARLWVMAVEPGGSPGR